MSTRPRGLRALPMRALLPNIITILALCFGLTGIRYAVAGEWDRALGAIAVAGVLDGFDGRIARLLRGASRFGAELDSLSDVIAFGVAPAVILYLWALAALPGLGWTIALAYAACCALRLARFNASIDTEEQPHKRSGYLTGVPAPAGAALALAPIAAHLWLGPDARATPAIAAATTLAVALLMISSLPTFSLKALRPAPPWRFAFLVIVALTTAALVSAPFPTWTLLAALYIVCLPLSLRSYAQLRRRLPVEPG